MHPQNGSRSQNHTSPCKGAPSHVAESDIENRPRVVQGRVLPELPVQPTEVIRSHRAYKMMKELLVHGKKCIRYTPGTCSRVNLISHCLLLPDRSRFEPSINQSHASLTGPPGFSAPIATQCRLRTWPSLHLPSYRMYRRRGHHPAPPRIPYRYGIL